MSIRPPTHLAGRSLRLSPSSTPSSSSAPLIRRQASTTTHAQLYPSGARLAIPSSASSSSSSPRPLSFPLGTTLGFLLGFSFCTTLGYMYFLPQAQERSDADLAVQLGLVQSTAGEIGRLVEELKAMEVQAGKVEEATRVTQRASVELRDIRERAAAALRRVEGLEEEGRELRTRINRLEGKATSAGTKRRAAAALAAGRPGADPDEDVASTGRRGSGGILWTGRSNPGTRLV
ncbi:hypothetical protein BDZ90DRAFT_262950 [Jaminaea rosea]|uniref:Uncharacterized protein n=1 Tax=Jaminaea rosea TaxID=1569628 RepID=A0A316UHJ7_9BASI|nr:hypothetical protein BDZ90DRAFT_262950 [Jaminaea rosea]PWN24732.1 hypothetical protein BDZ90DRAFT_262950 [Jaminaea rosea]